MRWKFNAGFNGKTSQPAIAADGTVYVGSFDGNVYAIDQSGAQKWRFGTGNQIYDSPTIAADGTVYIASSDGNLYSLNPDGSRNWSYVTNGGFNGSPAIGSDGTIYTGGDLLYALNPNGTLKWKFDGGDNTSSAPAIGSDGTIYIGGGQSGFFALDQKGNQKWNYPTGGYCTGPTIGQDGTIYFVSGGQNLYALHPDGSKRWIFQNGHALTGGFAGAAADGTIYIGVGPNMLALNQDGTQRWAFPTQNDTNGPPSIGLDGTLYFGTVGNVYAVNPDGTLQWDFAGPKNMDDCTPSIGADGTVYAGFTDGYLYAIGTFVTTVPISSLTVDPASVPAGTSSTGTVTLAYAAPKGGDQVALQSSDPAAVVPSYVVVPGGSTTASFTIGTNPVTKNTTAIITATSGGINATAPLTITVPGLVGFTIAPASVVGGTSSTGTLTLGTPAPPQGQVVQLTSDNKNVIPPTSVTIPDGQTTATFTISTLPVQIEVVGTVTASIGAKSLTATLTVTPPKPISLDLNPSTVAGGNPSTATVTLDGPAPPGGLVVSLSSDNPAATVPLSMTIAAGAKIGTFTITTSSVVNTTVANILAAANSGLAKAKLTINPLALTSFVVNPTTVTGGISSTGTVTLNGPAVAGGIVVQLSSKPTTVATVPTSVTIPAGQKSANFTITTVPVTTQVVATIQATYKTVSLTAALTVIPPTLLSISLDPAVLSGGATCTGTATLTGPAPKGGEVVKLTSSSTKATVPAKVTILAGKSSVTFSIKTVAVATKTVATITGTLGTVSKSTTLTINPPVLVSVTVKPATVVGLTSAVGTATLSGAAPAGGIKIALASSTSSATVPLSVVIAAGKSSGTFAIKTLSVSSTTVATIKGSLNGSSETGNLTINPPVVISLSFKPASLQGGKSSVGTVTLGTAAPSGGVAVNLKSAAGAASVPGSVTVPAGKKSATFTVTTTKVTSTTGAAVTATLGPTSKTATLTITK